MVLFSCCRTEVADLADFSEQLEGVYINRLKETEAGMTDLMWDWSSTPSICPPKARAGQASVGPGLWIRIRIQFSSRIRNRNADPDSRFIN